MRAMIASGIVPRAIEGRIRCLIASPNTFQLPVTSALNVKILDRKVMIALR